VNYLDKEPYERIFIVQFFIIIDGAIAQGANGVLPAFADGS